MSIPFVLIKMSFL